MAQSGAAGLIGVAPDDELAHALRDGTLQRNFQGYSTRGGASLHGCGISAISATAETCRQNCKTPDEWVTALEAGRLPVERGLRFTPEDRRRVIIAMRFDSAAATAPQQHSRAI